ncbi:MAG: hypothetical protein FD123_3616 [Bacteroidetes bacterium]|nr:MAG: hypothetical protein FD123_3616 [Bacteroidota bacterium]
MIVFTMDTDWACDEILEYALAVFQEYNMAITLFMTNKTGARINEKHEIAIHPNFVSLEFEKHIAERLDDFPDAKGCRSHSLFFTERFRPIFAKYKIEYQSNSMMYKQVGINPFYISPTTIEIPLYWMDNFCIEMEGEYPAYRVDQLNLESPGLKVINFHPIHLFLNTASMNEYADAKKYYHEPEKLVKHRNVKHKGSKDYLVEILEYVKNKNLPTSRMIDVNNNYRNN